MLINLINNLTKESNLKYNNVVVYLITILVSLITMTNLTCTVCILSKGKDFLVCLSVNIFVLVAFIYTY